VAFLIRDVGVHAATVGLLMAAFVLGTALVAACVVAGNVVAGSFRQTYVPPTLLARVITGMQFVNVGAIPLGALLGGAAATVVGTRGAIWAMTILYAVSGLILILGLWRGLRDLPSPSPMHASPVTVPRVVDHAAGHG
jgi:hypothetical protein